MAIEKKQYEEILKAAGFTEIVIAYLWKVKSENFSLLTIDALQRLALDTIDEQKRFLESAAERWKVRQSATS